MDPEGSTSSHVFDVNYVGEVQIEVRPGSENVGADDQVYLEWGERRREVRLSDVGAYGRSLTFHKLFKDAQTLIVHVDPPADVTFSTRVSHDATDINDGWRTR